MRVVALLCCIALFVGAPLNGLSPAFTIVAADMGFNKLSRDLYFASYISLTMMIGQIAGSLIGGYFADVYNRKNVLFACILLDSMVLFLFGIPQSLSIFLLLRLLMGFFQGISIPILFSLIGDIYSIDKRALVSAATSSCLGGGLLLGQLFCAYILSQSNWRMPFLMLGFTGLVLSIIVFQVLQEPLRGGNTSMFSTTPTEDKTTSIGSTTKYLALYRLMCSPTIALMLLQSVPGTIPWGILSTHLQDLLTFDFDISIPNATKLIGIFGIGGAIGGIASGLIGGYLHTRSSAYLPVFMGVTCVASSLLLQLLFSMEFSASAESMYIVLLLLLSGALASVSGTNIRTVIINVTVPEFRGSAIGLLNVLGCIGRGLGPSLTGLHMAYTNTSRVNSIRLSLFLWVISGGILCLGSLTVARDEDKVRWGLTKYGTEETNEN